jgi:hypothetical protein
MTLDCERYLAVDGALHGGIHLLAHQAAGEQTPEDIKLKHLAQIVY